MSKTELEIERRWIVPQPLNFPEGLKVEILNIVQMYLISKHTERIRQIQSEDGKFEYTHTIKKPAKKHSGQWETEGKITVEQFNLYMKRLCPKRQVIIKTRFVFELNDLKYELDQFTYPVQFRILEVEVDNINQEVPVPEWLEPLIEVSSQDKLSNNKISKSPAAATKEVDRLIVSYLEGKAAKVKAGKIPC